MPKRFMGSVPRPAPKRFRVSVPETDESVLAWIGAQSDLSNSVRALIRESLERNSLVVVVLRRTVMMRWMHLRAQRTIRSSVRLMRVIELFSPHQRVKDLG